MTIFFTPAIDDAVRIGLPEWRTTGSTVELRFSAYLGDEEYQQFKNDGMKVQLWSDIPATHRSEGEWGEMDLHDPAVGFSDSLGSHISLVAPQDHAQANLLSVICSVPFSGNTHKQFFFTYRLVYPSGEVKWLGQFGRNGSVHIESAPKDHSGLVLDERWETNLTPFVWNPRSGQIEGEYVAQISQPRDWDIWSIGKDSPFGYSRDGASLLFLVPCVRPNAIYCPSTVILSASPGIYISVDSSGKICASGSGSLLLQTCDSPRTVDSFIDRVLGHSSSLDCRFLGVFGNYIALTSPCTSSAVHTIVIPLIPSGLVSQINVPAASLASMLDPETSQYTIFAPAQQRVQFVDPITFEPGFVAFSVAPSGGTFVLSPLYATPTNQDNNATGSLSVTVLSPHMFAEDAAGSNTVLPTPPLSPHLHPIAHLTSSSQLNASTASISDLDEQDVVPKTGEEQGTPASEAGSSEFLRPAALTRQSSASRLAESYRENRSNVVVAVMRYVYFFLTLWFSMTFGKFWGLSNRVNRGTEPTSHSPQSEAVRSGEGPSPVNEQIPLLSRADSPALGPEMRNELPVQPTLEESFVPLTSTSNTQHLSSLNFTLFEVQSGTKHALILRAADGLLTADNLSEKVTVEVNGLAMSLNNISSIQEDTMYLDIDWDKPGRMLVKLSPEVPVL
ncbi:hypothetical protein GYMLUDRAFT_66538 [Collybiopsis luxurians FD-317 M1]|nr:hypothetical protein GYMLUDRAFT_66538 [Collybiopsis luxurians FD-317 M1]